MPEIYALRIVFSDKKHCLQCPLRDRETDGCRVQDNLEEEPTEFKTWEDQMRGCPLELIWRIKVDTSVEDW